MRSNELGIRHSGCDCNSDEMRAGRWDGGGRIREMGCLLAWVSDWVIFGDAVGLGGGGGG